MTAIAGYTCAVQIGGTPAFVGNLDSAEIQVNQETYDVTAFLASPSAWKVFIAGLTSYTVKISGNFDTSDAQQATLIGDIITTPGQTVTWQIQPKGTGASTKLNGTMILTQLPMKFGVGAKSTIEFDGQGTGALVFTA